MDTLNGGNEISNKNSVNFEELDLDNLLLDKKEDKLSNLNNNIDNNDNIINDINIDNDIISINTNIDKSNESKINASPDLDLDLDLDLDIEELH